jgi:hypothetical protein
LGWVQADGWPCLERGPSLPRLALRALLVQTTIWPPPVSGDMADAASRTSLTGAGQTQRGQRGAMPCWVRTCQALAKRNSPCPPCPATPNHHPLPPSSPPLAADTQHRLQPGPGRSWRRKKRLPLLAAGDVRGGITKKLRPDSPNAQLPIPVASPLQASSPAQLPLHARRLVRGQPPPRRQPLMLLSAYYLYLPSHRQP